MNEPDTEIVVLYCTAPPQEAESLAHLLLDERLVACINLIAVESVYRWDGAVCTDPEMLMVLKTASDRVDAVTKKIQEIHPYELPEIIVLPVTGGSPEYLAWVFDETRVQENC